MIAQAEGPTRQIYWNIDFASPGVRAAIVGLLGLIPLAIAGYCLWRRWKEWDALADGIEIPPRSEWAARTKRVLRHAFLQKRTRRKKGVGWSHVAIFWSFIVLFIGTLIVAIQSDIAGPLFDWYFFDGAFYLVYSFVLELAGLLGIAGCCYALYKRHVTTEELRTGKWNWTPHLWTLLVILVTGFLIEGARIKATGIPDHEKWASFAGYFCALITPDAAARGLHWALWWFHFVVVLGWLGWFGTSAMSHIFTLSANIWLARDIPSGSTSRPIQNLEEAETFGVQTIDQFANVHLRDADVCVECGRCTEACPAAMTGKPLSPKKIVNVLRDQWRANPGAVMRKNGDSGETELQDLTEIITHDELFACTTCGACEEECPAMIEQIEKIVELRRGLVLMKSEFPEETMAAFNNMEQQGNPWGKPADERTAWADQLAREDGIQVPIWGEEGAEDAEYLFWVGCAGAYDARSIPITKALATLMTRAGVKFAILGTMETCTGDSALRIGNEYLYQVMAQQNIETFKENGIKKIVVQCPHCFQTLNKDYRLLDPELDYEVIHHSELLARLINDGRLTGGKTMVNAALHDSCYLARHNNIVEQPREVSRAALGREIPEPERAGKKTMCCGAGGGRMWMEETIGKNVSVERSEQLLANGAEAIVTSCPFCKTMLTDGAKTAAGGKDVTVMDIAELLLHAEENGKKFGGKA